MLKLVDVQCQKCGKVFESYIEDENFPLCECSGKTNRIFTKFSFKLNFNPKSDMCGWGYDNYAHNRHWDEIKKIKEETGKTPLSYSDLEK